MVVVRRQDAGAALGQLDDLAAVGLLERVEVQDLVGRAEGDLTAVEAQARGPSPRPGRRRAWRRARQRPSAASSARRRSTSSDVAAVQAR
jgi:hypothetical protein